MNDNKRQMSVEEIYVYIDDLLIENLKLKATNEYLLKELHKWKPRPLNSIPLMVSMYKLLKLLVRLLKQCMVFHHALEKLYQVN